MSLPTAFGTEEAGGKRVIMGLERRLSRVSIGALASGGIGQNGGWSSCIREVDMLDRRCHGAKGRSTKRGGRRVVGMEREMKSQDVGRCLWRAGGWIRLIKRFQSTFLSEGEEGRWQMWCEH